VDIGVHQDGLVHISMMSHKFIKDPRELVKAGDVVKVKVLEVDLQRKRIALTMKLDEAPARGGRPDANPAASRGAPTASRGGPPASRGRDLPPRHGAPAGGGQQYRGREQDRRPSNKPREPEPQSNGVMAEALARALKR